MTKPNPEKYLRMDLTRSILDSAIRVQEALGAGLDERAYKLCLAHDLRRKRHQVQTDISLDLEFEGLLVPEAYRIDLIVDEVVMVEAKAVEKLAPFHHAQFLACLRRSGKEIALLLNFWASPLKNGGIHRLVRTRPQAGP